VPIEVKVGGRGATPEYASGGAAGADLCASESVLISPGERAAVPTDIHIEIPEGHVGLIWPRSGLALSQGIDTLAGVVDSDYRGEVRVVLINHGDEALLIKARDRVAQLLIQKVEHARFVRSDDLEGSERGSGGFGSTGR
jgi:dUTP pyrophosphatase